MSDEAPKSTTLNPFGSVFRAWFGVQSAANRQRDFASADAKPFIIAGVIFAIGMVIAIIVVVNIVLSATKPL
jgi:hypothetical protein